MPSICETLGSIPSTAKRKRKKYLLVFRLEEDLDVILRLPCLCNKVARLSLLLLVCHTQCEVRGDGRPGTPASGRGGPAEPWRDLPGSQEGNAVASWKPVWSAAEEEGEEQWWQMMMTCVRSHEAET